MITKVCVLISLVLCAVSVYFNRRSDDWADRCLFMAYATMFFGAVNLWR